MGSEGSMKPRLYPLLLSFAVACQPVTYVVLEEEVERDAGVEQIVDRGERDAGPAVDGGVSRCTPPADVPTLRFVSNAFAPPILNKRREGENEELAMLDAYGTNEQGRVGRPVLRRFTDEGPAIVEHTRVGFDSGAVALEVERTPFGQDYVLFEVIGGANDRLVAHRGWVNSPSTTTFRPRTEPYHLTKPAVFGESVFYFENWFPETTLLEAPMADGSTTSVAFADLPWEITPAAFDWGFFTTTETHLPRSPFVYYSVHSGPSTAITVITDFEEELLRPHYGDECTLLHANAIATKSHFALLSDCADETNLLVFERGEGRGYATQVHAGPAAVRSAIAFTGLAFVTLVWPEGEDAPYLRYFDTSQNPLSPPLRLAPTSGTEPLGLDVEVVRIDRRSTVAAAYSAGTVDDHVVADLRLARFEVCYD